MRIGYAQYPEFGRIYLVTLFLKKNTDNLSVADRQDIQSVLADSTKALWKGQNP